MRRLASLFVALLFLLSAVGPVAGVAAPASGPAPADDRRRAAASTSVVATAQSDIVRNLALHLTPDDPGHVRAVVTYSIPDSVTELRVYPTDLSELQSAEGFTRESGHFEWDGTTESPRLVFRVTVNRSLETTRALDGPAPSPTSAATPTPAAATTVRSGYSFVDTGPWAITPVPQYRTEWRWRGGGTVRLDRRVSVAGSGATGGQMAYLGEFTAYSATGNDQRFRLVVPAAASLRESPEAILRSLVEASGVLRVGARDESVFFVAAPTSVQWGPAGLEYGGSDAWVRADSRLDSASNVWLHEYVHTRQAYRPTTQTRWTVEAIAEYYAAFLTLKQERIDFDAFRDLLARGSKSPYAGDVLVDPSTWNPGTPYYKGGLVYGGIDRRTRVATDSRHTAMDVFARMNRDADRVTAEEFYAAVGEVAGSRVREFAVYYTQRPEAPRMWTYAEHREAFGETPPRIEYGDATFRVTGGYRNATFDAAPTLVVGETLQVTVPVRNTGGTTGEYSVTLRRNETIVTRTEGTLAPGERTTATLNYTFAKTGGYTLWIGSQRHLLAVKSPLPANVTNLAVDRRTVAVGESVELRATVTNAGDRPASGTFAVRVDGEVRAEWTTRLAANETVTHRTTLTFEKPGEYLIRVGDRSVMVTVEATGTPSTTNGETSDGEPAETSSPVPGFGFGGVLVALLVAAFALVRTGGRGT